MDLLDLSAPHGSAWELLATALVIILGPVLAERIRIPGMIGLLAGGWLIGPNGLGITPEAGGILQQLGDVGLLYLMFMAGLELDLGVFAKFRNQAITFALLTFAFPMGLGVTGGLLLGYSTPAAILLGSLFASHTLVVYPVIRRMGLASNGAVATAVGATVVTDTLALVVLAVVAGSTVGSASGGELVLQIVLGLAILCAWCFLGLPRLAAWFFRGLGQQRTLRYMFLVAAFLSGAVLAEMLGIEAIVGAFFAGLALNRFVPNESTFMERVEFFGSALFIPAFLISVGTIIEPAVLVQLGTIGLAAVFVAACLGGKLLAAAVCRPAFRFTWPEVGVMFALTSPQAAATLAATFVGLEIGLLTSSDVNAVMLLIVASLVVSSLAAARVGPMVPRPPVDESRLGRSIVAAVDVASAGALASVAARLAVRDGGVVHPIVVVDEQSPEPDDHDLDTIESAISGIGLDAELEVRHDRTLVDGVIHTAASRRASLLIAPSGTDAWLPTLLGSPLHALVSAASTPVLLVRPGEGITWRRTVLGLGPSHLRRPGEATRLAVEMAGRLAGNGELVVLAGEEELARQLLGPLAGSEQVRIVTEPALTWVRSEVGPTDLVVVPGGRNGAIGTARLSKQASMRSATVLAVADRTSVTATERATAGLGVVGMRAGGAA
jgi:Kef-type K+ transport system membrane component KefB